MESGTQSTVTSNAYIRLHIYKSLIIQISGFQRKVVRGKPAIGITVNFVNERSKREEEVAEISGVSYIFNQPFFKSLRNETGIDLENIVYYKCDTHYFVMCAHKQSLISKGVLKEVRIDVGTMKTLLDFTGLR